jgi:hypothetical protein
MGQPVVSRQWFTAPKTLPFLCGTQIPQDVARLNTVLIPWAPHPQRSISASSIMFKRHVPFFLPARVFLQPH